MIPDWQLPPGVDRGLWDYLHSEEMVRAYDEQMAASPLASADIAFCERAFPTPGRLVDLGCGTGRLCHHFASRGYDCVGVDLSDEMLGRARENMGQLPVRYLKASLVDLAELPDASFDYAACLFSTLGMVRGQDNRAKVLANACRLLRPGGRLVLHVHNRWYRGLGLKRLAGEFVRTLFERPYAGDVTMPQSYGGAPLTLHHFMQHEARMMLWEAGFATLETLELGPDGRRAGWPRTLRAYGSLILSERT